MRSICTAVIFVALTAVTGTTSASPHSLVPVPPQSAPPPIVHVQGRECRACRRDCYYEYRVSCGYSQSCRSAFTQCMRGCWYDVCR